jgi:uncharacterized protein (DUF488 family)
MGDQRIPEFGESIDQPRMAFTIGYEGATPESFLRTLVTRGIKGLVDVREVPRSRNPGFSSAALARMLESSAIHYVHIGSLGSPSSIRESLRLNHDLSAFFRDYERHLASVPDALEALETIASSEPTAIMCYERDPSACHRSIIASELNRRGFEIHHLEVNP